MDDEARQVLLDTREFLSDPNNWTRFANERYGRYCLRGAIKLRGEATYDARVGAMSAVLAQLASYTSYTSVTRFNDDESTTHADVLAILDRALA